jgi:hypothetical protein
MKFGLFNSFWDKYPHHLPFLNLMESDNDPAEWNLQISISRLNSICNSNFKWELKESIDLLLESEDWRPHLIAIISVATIDKIERDEFIIKLWERLSRGSWISPQILVVLSIIDEEFKSKAEKILKEGFSVSYTNLSAVDHHVSRGGSTVKATNGKVIGALHFLLNKTTQDINYIEEGRVIAKEWSERLFQLDGEKRLNINRP